MTRVRRQAGTLLVLASVLGLPTAVLAQDSAPPAGPSSVCASRVDPTCEPDSLSHVLTDNLAWGVGSRVRVKTTTNIAGYADGGWIVGRIDVVNPDDLHIIPKGHAGAVRISKTAVARVEVSDGRSRGIPALVGAGIGALGGLAIGAVERSRCEARGEWMCDLVPIAAVIVAAPIGAIVGAAIGRERWTKAPISTLTIGAAPVPGGFRIGGSVTF